MVVAESGETDEVLVPFNQSVVADTPLFDAAHIAWHDVADDHHQSAFFFSLLELLLQPPKLVPCIILLAVKPEIEIVTTLGVDDNGRDLLVFILELRR